MKAGALEASPDNEPLLDDICEIWTKIIGQKVGAAPPSFVRFAEACFVLLGEPRTRDAIRHAGRRWYKRQAAARRWHLRHMANVRFFN